MNAESPDPRSIRKKPGKSWGAAFTSHNEIHWTIFKNTLKNHCKIYENQWKNVWIFGWICCLIFGGFLGGFWEAFWLSKSMKNRLQKWANFLLIFWMLFERKCLPNGRPGGPQNRDISCIFRDPVPMTPPGKQMEPKWTKMDPKWCQNETKI